MMESLEMQKEEVNYMLLDGAEGKIQTTETQDIEIVNQLTNELGAGALHVETSKLIPCKCIDGRTCGAATEGPNAAGGTETIFVADDLTTKSFAADDGSVAGGMREIIEALQRNEHPVGGHSDNHHEDLNDSGCGANDRLPKIYDMIIRKGDAIKQYAEAILGTAIDDATHELIVRNAGARQEFSRGADVLEVMGATRISGAEEVQLERLEGSHKEVVAAINLRPGTTLSRQLLNEKYGADYQAFNVDAWSFQAAAEATSNNEEEARQKVIAMTYYNLATALVLCGPQMRVVIVQ
jgi:hypothetical protein